MLLVPKLRQPDAVSCLPTCVLSVLSYLHGEGAPTYAAITEACRLSEQGAVDELSFYGLQDEEFDVNVLQELEIQRIQDAIESDQPVILLLDRGTVAGQAFAHAVVACNVTRSYLTVMDPDIGEYVDLPLGGGKEWFEIGVLREFVIAGLPQVEFSG